MPLSWNEIRSRAIAFSKEWQDETSEGAEAQTFWNGFFEIFGMTRRRLASFEVPVVLRDKKYGYIDLFWKGKLIVEHKSKGKDLDSALAQAKGYFEGIKEGDLPRYIIVSDFGRFRFYDLDEDKQYEFLLSELPKKIKFFGFIAGYEKMELKGENPVNQKAVNLMANLYDELYISGYSPHELSVLLVKILFCLFADDTGIFNENLELLRMSNQPFHTYLELKTNSDGSDVGMHLAKLFEVLGTPMEKRQTNMDEFLSAFPYVDGGLFENKENFRIPDFNSKAREKLLEACDFDWSQISPAIFGSMFQSVMDESARRALGAHYTSETNILKLIKPLFLDGLWEEFEKIKYSKTRLAEFQNKLAGFKFLDPACGCGNFLVISYRELRILENEIIRHTWSYGLLPTTVDTFVKIKPNQFYGIEIEEFPARIAQTAMWLTQHLMNLETEKVMGKAPSTIPLKDGLNIMVGNALTADWKTIIAPDELSYILGNPPFVGQHLQDPQQKKDIELVFKGIKGAGVLDYVACWYIKAAQYIRGTQIKCAFVSTNSITQGEQVSILWNELLENYGIKINFAHKTFKWTNEAHGKAEVYCVIIGFANFDTDKKLLYEYENVRGEPHELQVKNINPYLVAADDIVIPSRMKSISDVPFMERGNAPYDGGNFLFSDSEKYNFLSKEPSAEKFFKRFMGSKEFLNDESRWCLWLKYAQPQEIKMLKYVKDIVEKVKEFRLASKRAVTKKFAEKPALFEELKQPETDYLLIPRVSSENRKYIPIGFFNKDIIVGDTCLFVPDATLYHFGILESVMHMAWVRQVCGRLKSDFRYSKDIVYNNFPWPENPSADKVKAIEQAAQNVLDIRLKYPTSSLADLYNPLSMPPDLVKAHQDLDKAVDLAYGKQKFATSAERMKFLFELYKKYTK